LSLYILAEQARRIAGERDDLAAAIMGRGVALRNLGRLEEAVTAYDESIGIYRVLVEGEHRQELRNDLALALYNLALAREKQGAAPAALEAAREARRLWEDLVNEGMKHLEPSLARARDLEARLTPGS
jgi:tetratricopeptide (TPR) repeat protein